MSRLHIEDTSFGSFVTADFTDNPVEATLTLADAILEHGRTLSDALDKFVKVIAGDAPLLGNAACPCCATLVPVWLSQHGRIYSYHQHPQVDSVCPAAGSLVEDPS